MKYKRSTIKFQNIDIFLKNFQNEWGYIMIFTKITLNFIEYFMDLRPLELSYLFRLKFLV